MKSEAPLTGRVALVTGAGRGIGSAIAARLAGAGADVVLHCASSRQGAETLAKQLSGQFAIQTDVVEADLGDPDAISRIFGQSVLLNGCDLLVNNAAFDPGSKSLREVDAAFVHRVLTVNLMAPLILTREFAIRLSATGRAGTVVNIGSVHSQTSVPGYAAYAASKGGLESLTRQLAVELGSAGIRVNAVVPGFIAVDRTLGSKTPEQLRAIEQRTPLGRIGQPEDVADTVLFLCSDASAFLTGEVITIDGGASRRLPTYTDLNVSEKK